MVEIYKPIFIVGTPRSGTTLLYDLLACHKDVAFFSQIDLREFHSSNFMQFVSLRRRIFESRNWAFSRDGFEFRVTTSFETPHEFNHFWNKYIPKTWATADDVKNSSYEEIRNEIASLLKKKNKKRFLSKNPIHSIRIGFLKKIFDDAIFINIIRHGIPVVTSMTRGSRRTKNLDGYFGLPLKKNNQMDFDLLERHARQWIDVNTEIQNCRKFLNENQYFQIKYEDLISDPKDTIKEIFDFCELEFVNIFDGSYRRIGEQGNLEIIPTNLSSTNVKYKDELSESEIEKLHLIMKDLLSEFKYT